VIFAKAVPSSYHPKKTIVIVMIMVLAGPSLYVDAWFEIPSPAPEGNLPVAGLVVVVLGHWTRGGVQGGTRQKNYRPERG